MSDRGQRPPDPEAEGIPAEEEHPARKRTDDAVEDPPLPGDTPQAINRRTTAAEQHEGESVDEKLSREEPDRLEETAPEAVGRLVDELEGGRDNNKELTADTTADREALSAEEAAVHIEPE